MFSARALIVENPLMALRSTAKNGTSPQRSDTSSRSPVSRLARMMGCMEVGATL
jgi:hypothetical protein